MGVGSAAIALADAGEVAAEESVGAEPGECRDEVGTDEEVVFQVVSLVAYEQGRLRGLGAPAVGKSLVL